jgi:hypothetical protein
VLLRHSELQTSASLAGPFPFSVMSPSKVEFILLAMLAASSRLMCGPAVGVDTAQQTSEGITLSAYACIQDDGICLHCQTTCRHKSGWQL